MKKRSDYQIIYLAVLLLFLSSACYAETNTYRSTKIWTEEAAGTHMFFVSSIEIAVTEIRFSTENTLLSARMIIESQNETMNSLPALENAYEYITIGRFGISDDIKNLEVKFRVRKEWADKNTNYTTIKLNYHDNVWKESSTYYLYDDESYYYYESYPQKISYLSITGEKKKEEQPIASTEDATKQQETPEETTPAIMPKTLSYRNIGFYKEFFDSNKYLATGMIVGAALLILIVSVFLRIVIKSDYYENIDEMKRFIDEELAEGIPKKDIESELVHEGWPRKLVDKIVHNEKLPHDTEVMIKAYIQNMRNKMISDDHIKNKLIQEGWAEDAIAELFREFTSS